MLLHLPTGSGKTVIAALLVEKLLPRVSGRVLFIAHRKELLDQTAATLKRQIPGLRLSIEQGRRTADLDAQVIIASIQSLVHRKEAYAADRFSVIICDECHRALAPRWLDVIEYFHEKRAGDALLLGMTATPRRTDGRSAVAVFDTVAYAISKLELQELGYLVPVHYWSVRTDLHLDRVRMSGGDFQISSLSKTMNTPAIRALTLRAWQARGSGRKTLGFCASVAHARQLAADFTAFGYSAAVIDGRTRARDELLKEFRSGALDVLFNYGVLTEGFDDPAIECLLMVRPTTSPLVYNQCLGRGLRPYPGKRSCIVIDIVDRTTHQLQYGASELAGLPKNWRCRGRDPFRDSAALRGVRVSSPDAFAAIQKCCSLEDVQDLLMALPPGVIVAGLDGEPVPRYEVSESSNLPADRKEGESRLRQLLRQAGVPVQKIAIEGDATTGEILRAHIELHAPEVDNERFHYLLWHLERVTGWHVAFTEPPMTRTGARTPRALLRSILPEGHRIVKFGHRANQQKFVAEVSGIQAESIQQVIRDFERATGLTLELRGQLAFDF